MSHSSIDSTILESDLAHSSDSNSKPNIPLLKKNFTSNFRIIYIFSRGFGLLPFFLVYDTSGYVQMSRVKVVDWFWFSISISVHLILVLIYLLKLALWRRHLKEWGIFTICIDIITVLQLSVHLLTIIWDLYNRHRYIQLVNEFTAFDIKVN